MPSGLDAATTEANLKRVQRVFTLTPRFHRYDVTRVLLDGGIDSAAQIVRTGKPGFVQRFGPQLEGVHEGMSGEAVAKAVYASALQKHGFSLALMAQYGASMNTVSIGAIQALKVDGSEGPGAATLASLFGSLDYCACEDCRSMFSPAAYLVDLLSMLEGADAYSAFHTRRGDIAHLELSCENTNTVLPYIDIVNEVLEEAALSPRARPNTRQTTWTETELRLNPEPTGNAAAYDGPAQAVFPWSLPVDVPAVETRAHLERLGFSRAEAMALFAEDASDRVISEDTRTAERLGMGTLEFELATAGPLTPGSVPGYERWGFGSSEEGTWAATLAGNLRRVLRVTGLSFDELARLLTMRRIYRRLVAEPLEIGPPGDEPPTCDLDGLSIRGFDEAAADRIHRFLRIARRVDASWRELDIMLEAFGGMTASTLRAIADALEVRDSLGIRLDEGIWADLDQHSYDGQPSVFARIFQSNQVLAAAAGEFSLGGSLDEAQHFSHLRSGLGINDSDLRLLLDAIGAGVGATLDIVLVSRLFGHARLARALGLRVPELLRYLELVEVDPFASPGDTLTFAEIVQTTEASGVGLDGVEYLCRHRFAPELGFHPTDSALDAVLADIAAGKADVDALLLVDGVPAEVLRAHAEALFGAAEAAIDMVRILSLEPIQPAGTTDGDRIRELLEGLVSNADAYLDALPGPSGDPLVFDERLAAVIPTLIERRRSSGYEATVLAQLAGFSSLSADTVAKLAMDHVAHPSGSAVSVFRVLVDGGNREALVVFHKAGMLVAGLGLEARDLDWIFASAGAMNLSALPVAATDAATARTLFTQWHDVRLWSELLGGLTSSSEGLQAISDGFPAPGDERNEQLDALASISGWNLLDIDWARGAGWLGLDGDGLRDPARMARLRDMGVAVRRTGVRAEQLAAWARNAPDDGMAKATKQALRARYTEQTWADVIRPISDRMRELRRDALLDYIIARGDFESPESVYAYYLLDPEMNACMQTSRLKLAISSVQLYVQRVLLRLEDGVSFSPGFTRDWEWRKNYRVWEANRKVFFYPENWIVPELRSDKTPFFRDLEAHLQQGELTSDHVEQGFKLYLNKLHEVSNLAILDMHEVYEPETRRNVVNVVGRTRSQPYHYFYRKKVGDTHWTPWEPADVGISGEHLLLRSFNHRLFLFWLEFIEAAKTKGSKGEESEPRLRFVLCYTERKNGGWAPKKSSKVASWKAPDMNRENYSLWGTLLQNGRSLRVEVVGDGKYRFFRFDPCQDEFVQAGSTMLKKNLSGLANSEILQAQRTGTVDDVSFRLNEWSNSEGVGQG